MELLFNELSINPLASNSREAADIIIRMLETIKKAREHGFTIMRTHEGFYADLVAPNYSFSSFFADDTVSLTLKVLFRSVIASPFIADTDSEEAEEFVMGQFNTQNHLNQEVAAEGLAAAYLFNSPSLSLSGHKYWEKDVFKLKVQEGYNSLIVDIVNLYSIQSTSSDSFQNWLKNLEGETPLNSEVNIYKSFPSPKFNFEPKAIADIISWYYDDKRFLTRVKDLLNDIPSNPFSGGIGKTETLTGGHRMASKRIIKKDRIVYTYRSDGKIIIHQCRKHYGDT